MKTIIIQLNCGYNQPINLILKLWRINQPMALHVYNVKFFYSKVKVQNIVILINHIYSIFFVAYSIVSSLFVYNYSYYGDKKKRNPFGKHKWWTCMIIMRFYKWMLKLKHIGGGPQGGVTSDMLKYSWTSLKINSINHLLFLRLPQRTFESIHNGWSYIVLLNIPSGNFFEII